MRTKDKLISILILICFFYVLANLGSINSFLTFSTDKTYNVGDSQIVIPEAWNTTSELNITDKVKTNDSITNNYVIWNVWENWPEDHITSVSTEKFKEMEHKTSGDGNYIVVNESVVQLGGQKVSKQYFYNPSRDTDKIWDCMGVNYVFSKEGKNYAVQIDYFTKTDYENQSYIKEVDNRFEDFMSNIHNKKYDGFVAGINHIYETLKKYFKF